MELNSAVTDTRWSPNMDDGRPGGAPLGIVIHWWGDPSWNQTHDQVVNYLSTPRGSTSTSAHYVASAGRVTQLVHDYDRAWHCYGNNMRTIGIECAPAMSDADFETVAQLVAAIRAQWGHLPLSGHKDHYATACPGTWYERLGELSARADEINGHTPAPAPAPTDGIAVDGMWGSETTRALQEYLGTPADGVISGQYGANQKLMPATGTGWEWDGTGSPCITELQRRLGVTDDGIMGYHTITALQARLGVTQDGYLGAETVAALQTRLNERNL